MWTPKCSVKRVRWFILIFLLGLAAGCAPEEGEVVEPLRPLVYNETPDHDSALAAQEEEKMLLNLERGAGLLAAIDPTGEKEVIRREGGQEAEKALQSKGPSPEEIARVRVDLSSPESLARAVFRAIAEQDRALFYRVLIDEGSLQKLAKVKEDTAKKRVSALRRSAMKSFSVFSPGNASEEPEGGLAKKIVFEEFKAGKAGTIWGRKPRRGEEVVQHWNNTLQFSLRSHEEEGKTAIFSLSLGRILKTPSGEWRLASSPEASGSFRDYLNAGFHLKPEMMQPEHHPFPLSVGNFWRYKVKRPGLEGAENDTLDNLQEEVRLEVTGVDKFDGYRLVTLRRIHKRTDSRSETVRYLVTPRRLYFCSSYCKYKIKDIDYVIAYIRQNSPLLIFPLQPNDAWRAGGVKTRRNPRWIVGEERELAAVPAGDFRDSLVIKSARKGDSESRHFKPGIGVVRRSKEDRHGLSIEELIEYRILTTE